MDSLPNESSYNGEYAKLIFNKPNCRMSWKKGSTYKIANFEMDISSGVDSLVSLVKLNFSYSCISRVRKLIFPLKEQYLTEIRTKYLDIVFGHNVWKHEILIEQLYFAIRND